jgi:hypothetical protein
MLVDQPVGSPHFHRHRIHLQQQLNTISNQEGTAPQWHVLSDSLLWDVTPVGWSQAAIDVG